mgnify:FL=1
MKKFLLWLAKIFNVDLTVEKIIYRDKIVEVPVEKLIALEGTIDGDVTVKGNLLVEGNLTVTGEVTCYAIKGI